MTTAREGTHKKFVLEQSQTGDSGAYAEVMEPWVSFYRYITTINGQRRDTLFAELHFSRIPEFIDWLKSIQPAIAKAKGKA